MKSAWPPGMCVSDRFITKKFTAGVTNLFETESYFLLQIHAKGLPVRYTHFWNKIYLQLCYH